MKTIGRLQQSTTNQADCCMRHGLSVAMEPKSLIGALGSPYKSASAPNGPPESQNSYEYKKKLKKWTESIIMVHF